MLTEEMIAAGWIEHDGGVCPVALDSKLTVLRRDGSTRTRTVTLFDWRYGSSFPNLDIIAYRPEPKP